MSVACRTYGHAWDDTAADRAPSWGHYLWLRCTRCGTIRMDTIDQLGQLSARSYRYPEGYRDAEKQDRAAYRLQYLKTRKKNRKKRT